MWNYRLQYSNLNGNKTRKQNKLQYVITMSIRNKKISNEVNILYLNVLSLRKRKTDLQLILQKDTLIDVIVLNEIWIYRSEVDFIQINGFNYL